MTNANANANDNAPRGINLYTWNESEYVSQSYTTLVALKTAVNEANGNADAANNAANKAADAALVTEAFNRHKDCGKELYSGNEGANWTDEICINIYKYYMFDNDGQNRSPQDLDKHIKANLNVNGYHILGNDSVELNEENFVEKLAKLTPDEFKRCMIDISGFMLNQLLLGGKYDTLDDVKEALNLELNNSNKTEEIKNVILKQFQYKIKQATSGSNNVRSNNVRSNIVRSNKQRMLLGDDENSTVVSFAANMNRLKGVLGDESEDLKNEIKNAIEYINNECITDKTLKLNFFNCNIVNDLDPTPTPTLKDDQISLKALTEKLKTVFNSNEVNTNILILLNGNPGVIENKVNFLSKNKDEISVKRDIINKIISNNISSSKIKIEMDKFMEQSVKQIARLYNKPSGSVGGSKKRSRPNKRVKTKKAKAKAKATRKKQNKRLKKNKTLKKKNRRV
jgi:hypothetical protein